GQGRERPLERARLLEGDRARAGVRDDLVVDRVEARPLDARRPAMSVRPAPLRTVAAAAAIAAIACWAAPAIAHVGSPDTWFEGTAGPYRVRVVVRAPGVVPGLAEIAVRVLSGKPEHVTVQLYGWHVGANGAPPPAQANP